jgi:hypothetical protein
VRLMNIGTYISPIHLECDMFTDNIRDYFRFFGLSCRGIAAFFGPSGLKFNTIVCFAAEVGLALPNPHKKVWTIAPRQPIS